MTDFRWSRRSLGAALLISALCAGIGQAQTLSGPALAGALKGGGYVLLMRHAASPRTTPDAATANKDNPKAERQLDQAGRDAATAMGAAITSLRIPIGLVLSSPTYRALETARYAKLPAATTAVELGEGGGAEAVTAEAGAAWLKQKVGEAPRAGTNTVIITHFPNLRAAMGDALGNVGDGEALVLHPDGKGGAPLVGRIKIEDWPALAAAR